MSEEDEDGGPRTRGTFDIHGGVHGSPIVPGAANVNVYYYGHIPADRAPPLVSRPEKRGQGPVLSVYIACPEADAGVLKELEQHLDAHEKEGRIEFLHRGRRPQGLQAQALHEARLVVLLLSPAWKMDDDEYQALALRLQISYDKRWLLAVRFRYSDIDQILFRDIQPRPRYVPASDEPIFGRPDADEAWRDIARNILRHWEYLKQREDERIIGQLLGFDISRPGLQCDRTVQWRRLNECARQQPNHIILMPGDCRQGHSYLLARMYFGLARTPPRHVVRVNYGVRTDGKHGYLDKLTEALREHHAAQVLLPDSLQGVGRTIDLLPTLRRLLRTHNLVLLHEPLAAPDVDEHIFQCLTEWLPELLSEVHRSGESYQYLKIVQPFQWMPPVQQPPPRPAWWRWIARLLLGDGWLPPPPPPGEQQQIDELCTRIEDKCRNIRYWECVRLAPLSDISPVDVRSLCEAIGMDEAERERLVKAVFRPGSTTAEVLSLLQGRLRQLEEMYPFKDADAEDHQDYHP